MTKTNLPRSALLLLAISICLSAAACHHASTPAGVRTSPTDDDASPGDILDQLGADEVRIYRDFYGVPHIFGGSDQALFFGAGYAHASDHLEAMLLLYRMVAGRLAEIDGPSAFAGDYFYRLLRVRDFVETNFDQLSAEAQEAATAFADGVNYYMAQNPADAPSWAEPIAPADVAALAKYQVLARAVEQLSADMVAGGLAPPAGAPVTGAHGSNFWVLAPSQTAGGAAMLQGDPHVPWDGPNAWYEIHLVSRDYNVSGAAFFGVPGVWLGHNGSVAWTITNNSPDVADAYLLTMNPANLNQYQYDGAYRDLEVVDDTIAVQGQSPEPVHYYYAVQGPLVHFAADAVVAGCMATWDDVGALDQVLAMNRASDLASFTAAVQMRHFVRWNVGYGDVNGNIYYVWNGTVYRRPPGYDFTRPVPGNTSATAWGDLVPFDELPQETNPAAGFFQNCNTAAWFVCPGTTIHQGDYPNYVVGDFGINGRGARALAQLAAHGGWTVDQLQALSTDQFSMFADAWLPALVYCWERQRADVPDPQNLLPGAIAALQAWDRTASLDAQAVLLMQAWIAGANALWGSIDPRQTVDASGWSAAKQQNAVKILLAAATAAQQDYGAVTARWGDIHYFQYAGATFPLPGSGPELDTLLQDAGTLDAQGRIDCDTGSSFMMLVELANPPQAWTTRPISESLDPASPHYSDGTRLYVQQEYKPAWFTQADILANPDPHAPQPLDLHTP